MSDSEIRKELRLPVTVLRIQQVLSETPCVAYKRPQGQIYLTKKQKNDHIEFAKLHLG